MYCVLLKMFVLIDEQKNDFLMLCRFVVKYLQSFRPRHINYSWKKQLPHHVILVKFEGILLKRFNKFMKCLLKRFSKIKVHCLKRFGQPFDFLLKRFSQYNLKLKF
jgi:hypothetical protein